MSMNRRRYSRITPTEAAGRSISETVIYNALYLLLYDFLLLLAENS